MHSIGKINCKYPILELWRKISNKRRRQLVFLAVFMLIASLSEVISISAVLPFLGILTSPDLVFKNETIREVAASYDIYEAGQLLFPLTVIFAGSAIIAGILRISMVWGETRLGHAVGSDISVDIFRRTLHQNYEYHTKTNSSEVITAITVKTDRVVYGVILPIISGFGQIILLICMLFAVMVVDLKIALTAMGGFSLVYLVVIWMTKKMLSNDSVVANTQAEKVVKILQEGTGGIRDIIIESAQGIYADKFSIHDGLMRKSLANLQIIGTIPRYGVESLGIVLISILAYNLNTNSGGGLSVAVPVLGTLAIGSQKMLPVVQQLFLNWTKLRGARSALEDVIGLLNNGIPASSKYANISNMKFERQIDIKKISYCYTSGGPLVLRDINLTIKKGSKIGFIGSTGSGKSTLIDIVMGLLTPKDGDIYIDGNLLNDNNRSSWMKNVSHVPQNIFLNDATILENIAFGVHEQDIDIDRVMFVSKIAQIDEFINSQQQGYKTRVGERGVMLSGGQRQRIGIARALYKDSDILILDEATSALDTNTEEAVMMALDSLERNLTIFMIAHRLSTLNKCDCIIQMDNGAIKSILKYEDLVVK